MNELLNHGFYRAATISLELKVADVSFNTSKIIEAMHQVEKNCCAVVVFPELCITGYTCGDLFYQQALLDASLLALIKIKIESSNLSSVFIVGLPILFDNKLYNCAAVINRGKIKGIVPKTYLPNTNEYYEERWFSPAVNNKSKEIIIDNESISFGTDLLFKDIAYGKLVLGIEICEDLWAVNPPSNDIAAAGANLIANLSASSEYLGKSEYRKNLVISQSGRCIASYIYCSAGPGESSTDLVFAGHSLIAENGVLLGESQKYSFKTEVLYSDIDIDRLSSERIRNSSFKNTEHKEYRLIEIDLNSAKSAQLQRKISQTPFIPENINLRNEVCREIIQLQTTALAKRLLHTGLTKVVIGISGGLDSTLALLVCYNAFKKINLDLSGIISVTMPGFGTTDKTKKNAICLIKSLGLNLKEVDITKSVNQHFEDIGQDPENHDIAYENAQARERTQILMDIANQINGLVVGTGDLSEMALGWSTYNGDHISMYGVNAGVPKTLVKYIVGWFASEHTGSDIEKYLIKIINTPISPELLPPSPDGEIKQKTEEKIGLYIRNDFFLYYFVRFGFTPEKIIYLAKHTFPDVSELELTTGLNNFLNRFFNNQFKRTCTPDAPKIGSVALSPRGDWRMPSDAMVNTWIADKYF